MSSTGGSRSVSRAVVALSTMILGVLAWGQLDLTYLPTWTFPELHVELGLPDTGEVEDITRRYVVALESSIRTLGQVRGHSGEVSPRGARLTVRFEPGTDPERKAARLESELQSLRRTLPRGASVTVNPARQGGGGMSAVIWLPGSPDDVPAALLRDFLDHPTVRDVQVAGRRQVEIRKTKSSAYGSAAPDDAVRKVGYRRLGAQQGDTRVTQVLDGLPEDQDADRRALLHGGGAVPISSIFETELRSEDPQFVARVQGRPGQVLLIYREYDASPVELSAAVRDLLQAHGLASEAELLIDEAEPLAELLRRWAVGFLVAMVFGLGLQLWLYGRQAWPQIFVLPVALSAVFNVCWALEIPLDITTLPAALPAVGAAQLFQILRMDRARPWPLLWILAAAAALPVAVVLAGGPLGSFLGSPARLFAVTTPVACVAVMLIPALRSRPMGRAQRLLKALLRRPWAILLGVISLAYVLFVVFGSALMPHPGRLTAATADILLQLRFPEGISTSEAAQEVARAEQYLDGRADVEEYWSLINQTSAWVRITMQPEDRSLVRLRTLAARFESQLSHVGASLTARPLAGAGGGEPMRFEDSVRDKPETDRIATYYRFILRSTDLAALDLAWDRLEEALGKTAFPPPNEAIVMDWGRPTPRLELLPLAGTSQEQLDAAVQQMRRRTRMAPAQSAGRLPGSEDLLWTRFQTADAPSDARDVPSHRELARLPMPGAEQPVSIDDLFEVRSGFSSPVIKRQDGSFVLPVTIRFIFMARGQRPWARSSLHAQLRKTRLPDGVTLLTPRFRVGLLSEQAKRLMAVASILPLFWLGLAACRLGSIPLGFAALTPIVFGVAAAAPAAMALRGHLDEMMLLAMLTGLVVALPYAMEVVERVRVEKASRLAVAPGYRWLSRRLPLALVGAAMWLLLFLVPALGTDPERQPWAPGMILAALVGSVTILTCFLALPVLLRSVDLIRLRDREAERLRAHPPVWSEPGTSTLAVRNLCKVYGNGFQALRSMEFDLEPGIIGLLGPNGAGKTTLLRTLCGLLEPTRGQVHFRGVAVEPANLPEYRRLVGFLPQSFNAYEGMVVRDFLDYWALELELGNRRERSREIERVLVQVGLEDAGGKAVRKLSGGMRRRIGIARALLGSPPILIVDEPTTGLDVESRNRLRESLLSVAGERIILFSTHIAGDVAATASRILMMNQGRLLFDGTAGDLMDEAHGRIFEHMVSDDELREFSKLYRVTTRVRTLDGIRVRAVAGVGQEPAGKIVRPNLEEAYLAKLDLSPQGDRGPRKGSLLDLGA